MQVSILRAARGRARGSGHRLGALGLFWAERLGRTDLVGRQVSARGGAVRVQLAHPESECILLMGRAVTVFHAELVSERETVRGGVSEEGISQSPSP